MDPRGRGGGVEELVGSMPSSMASFTIASTREFSTEPYSSPSSSPLVNPDRTHLVAPDAPAVAARVGNGLVSTSAAGARQDPLRISSDPVVRPAGATAAAVGPSAMSSTGAAVRYRECLKNHAASVGGHVVDGCGEFMAGEEADGLRCSVCGCHRSFHRKEMEGSTLSGVPPPYYYHHHHHPHLPNGGGRRRNGIPPPPPLLALPPPQTRRNPHPYNPTPVAAFAGRGAGGNDSSGGGGGTTTESSSEEQDAHTPVAAGSAHGHGHGQGHMFGGAAPPSVLSRKRFRTKFTAEQKEKMLGFADAVGWRMQRKDEVAVERFCAEVGVSRQVFKVWMHNNKHVSSSSTSSKTPQHEQQKQQQQQQHGQTHEEERKMEARGQGM